MGLWRRLRLWVEFVAIYLAAPIVLALLMPPSAMFPLLFGLTLIGMVLLHFTDGFYWRDLTRGMGEIGVTTYLIFVAVTVLAGLAVMQLTRPDALFYLIRNRPAMMVIVIIFYPLVSALPQEIVFRPLFFRRYGSILPALKPALVLNAALFSLAHLMYWSWIVAGMTFVGGLVFAWVYEARRSFPAAVIMHAFAGWIIFGLGLGVYFFSGNVVRPF